MIESILGILEAGLSLWNTKEARKYQDQVIKLKKEFYEEYNKPDNERSDARLDNIMRELLIIGEGFTAEIRTKDAKNS